VNGEQDNGAGLDSRALIRIAVAAGYQLSPRLLETLRTQGLLPRPQRTAQHGRTPVWTYPPGAERQLLSLLAWREQTKDPDVLRVLLWLDGFPIALALVREALATGVQQVLTLFQQAIAEAASSQQRDAKEDGGGANDEAVSRIAAVLAAKRGARSLPRHSRVSATERARSVELLLRTFALGQRVDATPHDADTIERVLGVGRRGRRDTVDGSGPWLVGPPETLFDTVEVLSLPAALQAVRAATDAELETARGVAMAVLRYLPLMARMMAATFDDDNYAGFAGVQPLDQHPEIAMIMVPVILSMLQAGWHDQLHDITAALARVPELSAQTELLLQLPAKTIQANLANQPHDQQQAVQRIIDAAIDGKLNPPGRGLDRP